MLEEQRRFAQLSQCLQALDAPQSAALLSAIRRKNSERREDEDDSEGGHPANIRPLLSNGQLADDASNAAKFRRSRIVNELTPLMEASMVSTIGDGGSRPSSGASFAELSSFQQHPESCQSDDSEFGKKLSIQWDNAHVFSDDEQSSRLDGGILRLPIGDDAVATSDDEAMLDDLELRMRVEQEHRDYLARELCLSQSRLAQLCAKNMKIYNLQQQVCQKGWARKPSTTLWYTCGLPRD